MPEQVGDLLKSKATMWIAPTGEAEPDETTVVAGAAWGGNWVKVGWTKEALSFLYEFEEAEFPIEQALGPVKRRKTSEHATFETVLAEATGLNLAYVAGDDGTLVESTVAGATQKAFEELELGNEAVLTEWACGFEGLHYDSDGDEQPVRVFFPICTININGELTFSQKDDDYTGIPVQVKALADPANSFKMLKWQRVTAPATG